MGLVHGSEAFLDGLAFGLRRMLAGAPLCFRRFPAADDPSSNAVPYCRELRAAAADERAERNRVSQGADDERQCD
jgi:hypothetical protein